MSALLASDASGSEFEFAIDVKVNGREIPREAIYKEMQYHPAATPRDAIYAAARALVFGELLRERAIALELCDADIETASEAFDQALEQLLQQEVPVTEPAEAECRAYFEQHRDKFRSEPLAEVRHILLAAEPNDADALAKANVSALELLKQIQDASDPLLAFAELAKSVSGCSSNSSGGSLGQIGRGDTVGPFQQAVFAQGSGLVPQPVETEYGVHLIYVEHSEPGQPLEFDYVSDRIADYLQERQRRQLTDAYLQELVKNAEISGLDL
ncbi:peptidylprolyl isomerase [Biformimicrobium ophioploci]|uniref:peptidylprolyl isomerase n=1 Tax=Biformimicrobium ophioploci TaxID=3036711 RepID=A0ABQ6M094_9GAMM|nr:peptidylprolyl isomerase [Microbulbifer sp. NKW57]GMG87695.1 peptidylprolyl isomerase [Microbulbifer sp. NKW57]